MVFDILAATVGATKPGRIATRNFIFSVRAATADDASQASSQVVPTGTSMKTKPASSAVFAHRVR